MEILINVRLILFNLEEIFFTSKNLIFDDYNIQSHIDIRVLFKVKKWVQDL